MEWKKIRNVTTNVIEGHLMATGRPRLDNLGRIGLGCRISLMHGPILDGPLPTTKVGDLRINHLQFEIIFDQPVELEDGAGESKIFKVGYENELYGEPARKTNLARFNDKKAKKNETTEEILRTLMQSMSLAVRETRDDRRG